MPRRRIVPRVGVERHALHRDGDLELALGVAAQRLDQLFDAGHRLERLGEDDAPAFDRDALALRRALDQRDQRPSRP